MHELRGVQRAAQAERNRQQERIKRAFQGAVGQRREAELGLEIVGPTARLPGIIGLLIALVPHLAEQGGEVDLRVGVIERPVEQARLVVHGEDAVGARREGQQLNRRALVGRQFDQGLLRGGVAEQDMAVGVGGQEALVAGRRLHRGQRRGMRLEDMDFAVRAVARRTLVTDLEPDAHPPGAVADNQRAFAQQPAEGRGRDAPGLADGKAVDQTRRGRVLDLPVQQLSVGGADQEVGQEDIQGQGGDIGRQVGGQLAPGFPGLGLAQKRLLFDLRIEHQGARTEQGRDADALVILPGSVHEPLNRPSLGIDNNRVLLTRTGRNDPAALVVIADHKAGVDRHDGSVCRPDGQVVIEAVLIHRSRALSLELADLVALEERLVFERDKIEPAVLGHDVGNLLVFFNAKRNRPGGLAVEQLGQPHRPAEFGLGRRPQGQRLSHNHKQDSGNTQNDRNAAKADDEAGGLIVDLLATQPTSVLGRRQPDINLGPVSRSGGGRLGFGGLWFWHDTLNTEVADGALAPSW